MPARRRLRIARRRLGPDRVVEHERTGERAVDARRTRRSRPRWPRVAGRRAPTRATRRPPTRSRPCRPRRAARRPPAMPGARRSRPTSLGHGERAAPALARGPDDRRGEDVRREPARATAASRSTLVGRSPRRLDDGEARAARRSACRSCRTAAPGPGRASRARPPPLTMMPRRAAARDPGDDRDRRGQDQRAGRGDDEHRERPDGVARDEPGGAGQRQASAARRRSAYRSARRTNGALRRSAASTRRTMPA